MVDHQESAIARTAAAIEQIRRGGMVIMVDDEDRENEGDLVFAAEFATADKINFMAKEARGLICLTMDAARIDHLQLPLMDQMGRAGDRTTAFTLSIEAREGVTTGISAQDRAHTVQVAIADQTQPQDIVVPGHIFPLRARDGGVLERAGHTEGSVDLARLAGLKHAAVICEIMKDDGTMARMPDLREFSARHHLPIIGIADLITFRLLHDSLVEQVESGWLETDHGKFRALLFRSSLDQSIHMALVKGDNFQADTVVDVRVHRQRPIVDVFARRRDDSDRIAYGLQMLAKSEHAVMLYLNPGPDDESHRADFLQLVSEKMRPAASQPGPDLQHPKYTPMGQRHYGIGAQILRKMGVKKMLIHAVSPQSLRAIGGFGLEIVGAREIP